MRRRNVTLTWALLACLAAPADAAAQGAGSSGTSANAAAAGPGPAGTAVRKTAKNTLVVNHLELGAETDDLYVLEVADGDHFQVLFENSYPACFSYSITATDDALIGSANQMPGRAIKVPFADLKRGRVTMQHRDVFAKYRVTAALTCDIVAGGAPERSADSTTLQLGTSNTKAFALEMRTTRPIDWAALLKDLTQDVELRELSFDLWVRTAPKWTVAINGGVAFQNFKSPLYYIKSTTANGTTVKTFEEEEPEEHKRPAVMTLISVYPPWPPLRRLGAAVGFGGQGSDLRYYFGGAVSLGGHLVFTAGKAFGFVSDRPLGQEVGQPPISDNVLANVRSVPASAWYFGFALGFDVKSKPDTISALTASSTSKPPALSATSAFTGVYATENDVLTVTSDGVGVTVRTNTSNLSFPVRKDNTFTDVAGAQSATFDMAADGKTAASVVLKLTGGELKAPRARKLDMFSGKYGDAATPHVVAVDGSALTVAVPGTTEPVRLSRKGDLKFSDGTRTAVFKVDADKVVSMTFDGKTLQRLE
jgi:hypothetical protein